MADKIRVGIIGRTGKGDYGHAVDVAFTQVEAVEIVALADEHPGGREAALQRTGAATGYADYRQMLARERLDVVAICPRWIDQHHAMLKAAAEAGCHVYMEKPFCQTLEQCDDIVRELEMRHLQLGIAHLAQYSPILTRVLDLIAAGEIGELLELRARGKEDRRGGGEDLWVLGSHILAMMRSLAGGQPLSCTATVSQDGQPLAREHVVDGAEGIGPLAGDAVQARYDFPGGTTGYFASRRNMAGNPTRFAIQIFGSKGIIEMESGYMAGAAILRDSSWSPGRSGKGWKPISSAGIGQPEPIAARSYGDGHVAAIRDLLDCIREHRPTRCSAADARAVTEMIVAIFESQRVGRAVPLPLTNRAHPLTMLD
jgi:predicted dehydrogenase